VHVQNASLAGGVAIGSAANLKLVPGFSVATGMLAACISTLGYHYVTPALERAIRLHDTCGVHNLHGMPGGPWDGGRGGWGV
jgi:ammonium transporter Rh